MTTPLVHPWYTPLDKVIVSAQDDENRRKQTLDCLLRLRLEGLHTSLYPLGYDVCITHDVGALGRLGE